MPRPRYHIADDDVPVVHRWVRAKFRETGWPREGASLTAWDTFPLDHPTATTLQQWCVRFLDAAQWKQLHAVIRMARRDVSQTRTVRLSTRASVLLHDLAAREQLTLSETIERYLAVAAMPQPEPSPPPPAEPVPVPQPPVRPAAPKQSHPAVAAQKRSHAFVTTKKGVCYLTIKIGRENFHLMRIYHYTIGAQDKRDMRRLHPDVDFDWKKITRQLAEKREVCRQYRSRRRAPRAPRVREPFYGVIDPVARAVYVNDPDNITGTAALLDAIIAGRL